MPESDGGPSVVIRPATAADRRAIRRMVRRAGLDPTALRWPNFVVAVRGGEIVGVGQIRPYRNCPELGSLVVRQDLRGQGIGGRLVEALLARGPEVVCLECVGRMVPYYQRFGFEEIRLRDAPMPLRIKATLGHIGHRLTGGRVAVMRRGGSSR